MQYQASCHCGRVKFEVEGEGEMDKVTSCNCSMCQRKGILMWFVPRAALRLLTPEIDVGTYLFNKHKIKHRFCPACGIHPYAEGDSPAGDEMAAVNVRCIDGIDLQAIAVTHFDGLAL